MEPRVDSIVKVRVESTGFQWVQERGQCVMLGAEGKRKLASRNEERGALSLFFVCGLKRDKWKWLGCSVLLSVFSPSLNIHWSLPFCEALDLCAAVYQLCVFISAFKTSTLPK